MKDTTVKTQKRIYFDHAATTYVDPRVEQAMRPYWSIEYGNASALYEEGRRAKEAMDTSRKKIADILGASSDEIIFTGSGTESDNLAILGAARVSSGKGKHIITTAIEHHAVLNSCKQLEKEGFEVTYLPVDTDGLVSVESVRAALRPDTVLVSVMYANNEIGTIQPIAEISKVIRNFRNTKHEIRSTKHISSFGFRISDLAAYPLLHTDACQAAGFCDMNVGRLGMDLLTANGSKIYGPKGIGFLYVRRGIKLQPIVYGGGQEKRLRSGTEGVAQIVGLGEAFALAHKEREAESTRLSKLRDYMIAGITERVPKVVLNGHPTRRLPNNVNMSILDIEGEAMVLYLDEKGIACSTGSACTSESLDPSHVILALGRPYEFAHASMRFTLGKRNTKADVDHLLEVLPGIVETLRKISPVTLEVNATSMSAPEVFAGEGLKVKAKSKSYK